MDLIKRLSSNDKRVLYLSDIEFAKGNEESAKNLLVSVDDKCDSKIAFEIAERFNKCADFENAERYYKRSYETATAPKSLDSLYALAFLYSNNGMKAEAKVIWEQILLSLENDYGVTNGEVVDWAKREIEKLVY